MHTFLDSALNAIDRVSNQLSPLSSLLDVITNRLLPNVTAQACSGFLCYDYCVQIPCGNYFTHYTAYYSATISRCIAGDIWCIADRCGGC